MATRRLLVVTLIYKYYGENGEGRWWGVGVTLSRSGVVTGTCHVRGTKQLTCVFYSRSRSKLACGPPQNRWLPLPMNSRKSRGVTSTLLTLWLGIGYLMEEGVRRRREWSCFYLLTAHLRPAVSQIFYFTSRDLYLKPFTLVYYGLGAVISMKSYRRSMNASEADANTCYRSCGAGD
ncbi:hypothetical protein EVAR_96179_1 [Eumeta japonica]|uniref:Uncharacterized protein n=1 Tax=Eumeta variegata TaxID=151549 RepID=A0A4C1VJV4_EUMVA|nr:hypothetical protein EVAR_96179_1 [Eumeta japonica]